MTDDLSVGTDVDVEALMADIRSEVTRKREAGLYPPDVLAEIDYALADGGGRSDALHSALAEMRRTTGFTAEVTTESSKRLIAPIVAGTKRAIRSGMRWYVTGALQQVQTFAGHTVRAVGLLADRVVRLEERLEALIGEQEGEQAEPAVDQLAFAERFRGPEDELRRAQERYVEFFRDATGPVVDLGCGRGEFLGLLADARIDAYGVDADARIVASCVHKGFHVRQDDILEHLGSVEPASLGGIFCSQVIEHLPTAAVPRFFASAAKALIPGGTLVIESVNPQSLIVFASAFYVDLDHIRPLHPLTLRFLAEDAGFGSIDVIYLSPPSEDVKPQPLGRVGDAAVDAALERIEQNFTRVADVVFGPQDYALVAKR